MHDDRYARIQACPLFHELVAKRERFAWALSLIIFSLYLIFILLVAFEPQWLGHRIEPNSPTTWGIPIGVGIIVIAFLLTGVYVLRANGEFDTLTEELLEEVQA